MKRYRINKKIESKITSIAKLRAEILELRKADLLLSDKNQQFVEQEEDCLISGRPKLYEKKLVGRVNWKEKFTDEDTGDSITIDRSRVVRINGEWL